MRHVTLVVMLAMAATGCQVEEPPLSAPAVVAATPPAAVASPPPPPVATAPHAGLRSLAVDLFGRWLRPGDRIDVLGVVPEPPTGRPAALVLAAGAWVQESGAFDMASGVTRGVVLETDLPAAQRVLLAADLGPLYASVYALDDADIRPAADARATPDNLRSTERLAALARLRAERIGPQAEAAGPIPRGLRRMGVPVRGGEWAVLERFDLIATLRPAPGEDLEALVLLRDQVAHAGPTIAPPARRHVELVVAPGEDLLLALVASTGELRLALRSEHGAPELPGGVRTLTEVIDRSSWPKATCRDLLRRAIRAASNTPVPEDELRALRREDCPYAVPHVPGAPAAMQGGACPEREVLEAEIPPPAGEGWSLPVEIAGWAGLGRNARIDLSVNLPDPRGGRALNAVVLQDVRVEALKPPESVKLALSADRVLDACLVAAAGRIHPLIRADGDRTIEPRAGRTSLGVVFDAGRSESLVGHTHDLQIIGPVTGKTSKGGVPKTKR